MKKLHWIKEGDKYLLMNDREILLTLFFKLADNSSFIIHKKEYVISKKGFWNPGYCIKQNEEGILKLTHRFWGSNGKIVFNDGTEYSTEYKTRGGLQLRFLQQDKEILLYNTAIVNKNPVINFQVMDNILDADKLLVLAALGMAMFSSITGEDSAGGEDAGTLILMVG